MESTDIWASVGLDNKEIAIYKALLELGEATVLTVAKKSGIKRPTAYLVLNSLEAKGFVSRVVRGSRTFFLPQHPKKIVTEAELRLKELRDFIPELEAMMRQKDDRPRVMVYEGKDALDKAYDEYFVTKGEIVFMSNMELTQDIFARSLRKFDYISNRPEFLTREIVDDSETSRIYAKRVASSNRHLRIMPKAFSPFATDIGVFGNNTLITSGKKEFFTVKIESADIANAFRAMFEAMWQLSKKIEEV